MYHLTRLESFELIRLELVGRRREFSTTWRGVQVLKCYRNAIGLLNGQEASCPLATERLQELKVLS